MANNINKVLLIFNIFDGTGYTKGGIEYALSLDAVGYDVVCRPVKMTNTHEEPPEKIKEFLKKDLNGIDAVFNFNLPSEFCYKGGVQNIGGFAYETDRLPNSEWLSNISMMDKIIVPCNHQKRVLANYGLYDKTYVIPHSVDIDILNKEYKTLDFGLAKNTFKFYTICEMTRRKNLEGLLTAYLSNFDVLDNVALIVKTHNPSRHKALTQKSFNELVNNIKDSCRRFSNNQGYPTIVLITDYLSNDDIHAIHNSCNVYVTASKGEGLGLPSMMAGLFGNPIIAPNSTAFLDYINTDFDIGIPVDKTTVFGVENAPPSILTSDEQWYSPSIIKLGEAMRYAFDNKNKFGKTKEKSDFIKSKFSREAVGNIFKQSL